MSNGIHLKVKKLNNLKSELKKKAGLGLSVQMALTKRAYMVCRDAKIYSPINRGILRASIHVEKLGPYKFKVADGVSYGIFQELGTKYIKGKYFLQRAAKKNTKGIKTDIEKLYK